MLQKAIARINKGMINANLGGNVIKQRIARAGQGRSSGYRTIIIFRKDDKAFFAYGFAKNVQDNISKDELKAFKRAAKELLALADEQIKLLIVNKALIEVNP